MALQDITFAEGDALKLAGQLKGLYEAVRRAAGEQNYYMSSADPIRLVQLAEATVLAQVGADIDITGKGNLLYYAGEETIEHLGELYGERGKRLQPSAASVTVEYTLSAARNMATVIPAGYRVTPDKKVFFATAEPLTIGAGDWSGRVRAVCLTEGVVGNGFEPGEIKHIVDRNPFVESAVNVTESAGGADLEDIEEYRARIRLLPESFSVAGPDGAYRFWAMTANANITDVAVWSPRPMYVNIAPLLKGGEIPPLEILDAVYEVCSDRTRRPLTDFLHVAAPRKASYGIRLTYWLWDGDAGNASAIQEAVEAAITRYAGWQSEKLGRDINPSKLHGMLMEAGVKRVNIESPAFAPLERDQVGFAESRIAIYGGFESD